MLSLRVYGQPRDTWKLRFHYSRPAIGVVQTQPNQSTQQLQQVAVGASTQEAQDFGLTRDLFRGKGSLA